ncbi:NAD(P)H-dependent oxidoreductase [Corynebacterium felinum]|nr:NADPH-dependent FMN reductase [Corynebacterium felinum]MDF5820527.1 NAD(P)H-dependent oxidoreductase [Corynebacterium felinum]
MTMKIAIIVGSLRRGSIARKIAVHAREMCESSPGVEASIVEIRDLPLYDFDYDDPAVADKPTPKEYTQFRETIKACDGVLFVTSENNRTIPACVKNAVDVGSKPNSDVAWKNKPVGIISHSVGRMGGYSSQKNLRLALSYFDMPTVGQPEVFLGQSDTLIGSDDKLQPEKTVAFVQDYVDRFLALAAQHKKA